MGLNIEDAFLRGSCGGNTLVTSSNVKHCARVRKNFGNFNLRKRGTTTRGRCQNHFVKQC